MSNPQAISTYLHQLEREFASGKATEHSYRDALKQLLLTVEDGLTVINEPKRIEVGAPDYIVERDTIPIGFVEAKDVIVDLDHLDRRSQKQLDVYRAALPNLILTNYLDFRWYVGGDEVDRALLGEIRRQRLQPITEGFNQVASILDRFTETVTLTISSPEQLSQKMAAMARQIAYLIIKSMTGEEPSAPLQAQMQAFERTLIPNLTVQEFADMYAQTLAYGLFAARVSYRGESGSFSWKNAFWNIPKTNPFLRKMFQEIASDMDDRVAWLVETLSTLLAHTNMESILQDFGRSTRQEDPVVHFYETFLKVYNPQEKERRGVYYTPEPVVSYIVRSVDYLLKDRFNRPAGLADTNTMVLDPASGTGTFLYFVIHKIFEELEKQHGVWDGYVRDHLLPRVFGFELLMAPYAVAHMKLGVELQELGYRFQDGGRLGVYLTNTLEEARMSSETLFAQFISQEANEAAAIKREKPIMVILGNPPYSGISANMGHWIDGLLKGRLPDGTNVPSYYELNGQPLGEKKVWLQDDYVKFIRFGQWRIERTGNGIVAFVTNNGFLDNPTFRGMREKLLNAFSDIYILNLHGSTKRQETSMENVHDENVFDIQQGVSINIFLKDSNATERARVHYMDLWGQRSAKYDWLQDNELASTAWSDLEPQLPYYFFVPKDTGLSEEYEGYWKIIDVMGVKSPGVQTSRDAFVVDFDKTALLQRIKDLRDEQLSDFLIREKYFLGKGSSKYPAGDTRGWQLPEARREIRRDAAWNSRIIEYYYRPFDKRYVYYVPWMVDWPRQDVMQHMSEDNLAFIVTRQLATLPFDHVWVTDGLTDQHIISVRTKEAGAIYPLYLYPEDQRRQLFSLDDDGSTWPLSHRGRRPNLNPDFVAEMENGLSLHFVTDGQGDLEKTFGPEDVFHYAYAIFHCPTYRERYAEFLKIDFPRLPLTGNNELFGVLGEKGKDLINLHLLRNARGWQLETRFPESGDCVIERGYPKYTDGCVFINNQQCFEGVAPEVWKFYVGGYQVLEKWLKDRQGRELSFEDIQHYQQIIVALTKTIRIMAEIDGLIPEWPIQ